MAGADITTPAGRDQNLIAQLETFRQQDRKLESEGSDFSLE